MPSSPSRLCNYAGCRALAIAGTSRCSKHPAPFGERCGWQADSVRGTAAQRGYGSDWAKRRMIALRRDQGLCQVCKAAGRLTIAKAVDHIKPISQGGTHQIDNLQSICDECHAAKTMRESIRNAMAK